MRGFVSGMLTASDTASARDPARLRRVAEAPAEEILVGEGDGSVRINDSMDRITEFYRVLWPFLAADESQNNWLDAETGGRRNRDFLLEVPARCGIGPGTTVLDLGCGKGREACELAKELGCRVIGVDALERTLELARDRISEAGLGGAVTLVRGSMHALPLRDASIDFIWCRDTFNHAWHMDRTLAECARVLRPGGRLLNYSALKTDCLEPAEELRVTQPLGINPATLVETRVAAALDAAGLRVIEQAATDDQSSPFHEELDRNGGRDVMRLARLLRSRRRTEADIGADDYERLIAYYLWNIYLLIGKLTYSVWVAERNAEPGMAGRV